jgi:hypothetical protein
MGIEYKIETEVTLASDLSYCVAKATITCDGIKTSAHKLMFKKPDTQGIPDATFVAAAETIAIGRAIGFFFEEDETATEEEYQELVLITCKRIFELYQISYSGARQYVNDISNDDLRIKAQTYLESLMTKEALNKVL